MGHFPTARTAGAWPVGIIRPCLNPSRFPPPLGDTGHTTHWAENHFVMQSLLMVRKHSDFTVKLHPCPFLPSPAVNFLSPKNKSNLLNHTTWKHKQEYKAKGGRAISSSVVCPSIRLDKWKFLPGDFSCTNIKRGARLFSFRARWGRRAVLLDLVTLVLISREEIKEMNLKVGRREKPPEQDFKALFLGLSTSSWYFSQVHKALAKCVDPVSIPSAIPGRAQG